MLNKKTTKFNNKRLIKKSFEKNGFSKIVKFIVNKKLIKTIIDKTIICSCKIKYNIHKKAVEKIIHVLYFLFFTFFK
jgi:hypothetical protein